MRADQIHRRHGETGTSGNPDGRIREQFAEIGVQVAHVRGAAGRGRCQQSLPQAGGVRKRLEGEQADGRPIVSWPDVNQGGVHAVGRGAGHQADDVHRNARNGRGALASMAQREA